MIGLMFGFWVKVYNNLNIVFILQFYVKCFFGYSVYYGIVFQINFVFIIFNKIN